MSQWQSTYNSLEPHLRREDAMKAELHHRVDVSTQTKLSHSLEKFILAKPNFMIQ